MLEAGLRNCTLKNRKNQMRVGNSEYDREFRELLLNLLWPEPNIADPPRRLLAFSSLSLHTAQYFGAVFPGARILYIVRNGIEVVSSRVMWVPFGNRRFEDHCEVWAKSEEIVRWGENRDDFRLVRHENLRNPDTARALLDDAWNWIGLPGAEQCAESLLGTWHHPTSFPGEAEEDGKDPERRQDRWRLWTDEQRQDFAQRCGASMRYYGYDIPWLTDGGDGG